MTENTHTYDLRVWRQPGPDRPGRLVSYTVTGIPSDISLLETLWTS